MVPTHAEAGYANGIGSELAQLPKSRGDKIVGFDLGGPGESLDEFTVLDLAMKRRIATQHECRIAGLINGAWRAGAGVPPWPGSRPVILHVNFPGARTFTRDVLPSLKPAPRSSTSPAAPAVAG